ncbi:hypothetical protein D9Q81_07380 [Candidatus Korarchaeum cryptofilum]|uniref:EF-hand domain-containing protein n=1 Tax=Candidatus Korarchaeum cryptofilum TaxID=498846 RepID=A0A3R9Q8E0_9CREN|nr:C13 family peptidase [Candidatus Korarchaeum cryptofilum]RSN67841.1 hypothetical protein D9Q81_07380 [Candidatus Korarchaeum cryptofilum]
MRPLYAALLIVLLLLPSLALAYDYWLKHRDSDGDGIPDYKEVNEYHTDPNRADSDGDGLSDYDEIFKYHTDPNRADSDGDGLSDYDEIFKYHTDPNRADSNDDGISDGKAIELGLDPLRKYPIISKAYQMGFSDDVLREFSRLKNSKYDYELTPQRMEFLKLLLSLPPDIQLKFIKGVMEDGKIGAREFYQLKFLVSLPKQQLQWAAERNLLTNDNWDGNNTGDIFPNWVEKELMKTDPLTPNNLYVIHFDSVAALTPSAYNDMKREVRWIDKILSDVVGLENSYKILQVNENATYENFIRAINYVASRAGKDDIVYVNLNGHGGINDFLFWDKVVYYSDLEKDLEKLSNSTLIIVVDSCYSGSSLKWLCKDTTRRVVMTPTDDSSWTADSVNSYVFSISLMKEWDKDGNDFVSLEEVFQKVKIMTDNKAQICNENLVKQLYILPLPAAELRNCPYALIEEGEEPYEEPEI